MKKVCNICKAKINKKNDGLFVRQFLTEKEIKKISVKNICVDCKKEAMFANLISII